MIAKVDDCDYASKIKSWSGGDYDDVKQLQDGTYAAIGDGLLFTRMIYLNCDHMKWERRFSFNDREMCQEEFDKLHSKYDIPLGWCTTQRIFQLPEIWNHSE